MVKTAQCSSVSMSDAFLWAFASLARISWGVYLMGMHLMGMYLTGGTAQNVGTNEL
jgi:hypothetical protein